MSEFCCPNCGHKTNLELTSEIAKSQTVSLRLAPGKDGMLSASTIGGTLTEAAKLFSALGKPHGQKINTVVSGIEYDNGAVTISLLMLAIKGGKAP